jgi:serine O-acetyltransferase
VLRGYVSLFRPENARRGGSLLRLIISDYLAYYERYNLRDESPRRLAILWLPRLAHNPCVRATLLLRLGLASPRVLHGIWRGALIRGYAIDIQREMSIGPGFTLPHPLGIVFGWGVKIGANVSVLHHVTIGGKLQYRGDETQLCPVIEDDVSIWPNSLLFGPIRVGKGAVIGAGSWVTEDVPAGSLHRGVGAEAKRQADEIRAGERSDPSAERQIQD